MKIRWLNLLLPVVLLAQLAVGAARVDRLPAPLHTFHDYDVLLARYPLVLRGQARTPQLPLHTLIPPSAPGLGARDIVLASLRSPPSNQATYHNTAPLYYLLVSLPAVLLGVSQWTVRLGPLLALALLALVVRGIGRALVSPHVGTWAAVIITLTPAAYVSTWVGAPLLGNMLGVALVLWALLRSEAFSHLPWALLVGLFVATGIRWGESASEGLLVLASVVAPLMVGALVALIRVRRRPWGLGGLLLAVGVALPVGNWSWLRAWGEGRITDEARFGAGGLATWMGRLPDYPDALYYSLLGPLISALLWVALPAFIWRLRPTWKMAIVLASPLGLLLALTLSAKGNDYYAVGILPGVAVILSAGLSALPRVGRVLTASATALLAASWLTVTHWDMLPQHDGHTRVGGWCEPWVTHTLAADPDACRASLPATRVAHWLRRWRRVSMRQVDRDRIAEWLLSEKGRARIGAIPAGAGLVVLRWSGSEADVAELVLQEMRPDLWVVPVPPELPDQRIRTLIDHFDPLYFVTVAQVTQPQRRRLAALPPWVSATNTVLQTRDLQVVRVSGP